MFVLVDIRWQRLEERGGNHSGGVLVGLLSGMRKLGF